MTASELMRRITVGELREWAAFEQVFGPLTVQERVDVNAGLVSAAVLRAAGAKNVDANDLTPDWDAHEQTPEEQMAAMKAAFTRSGHAGRDHRASRVPG